jgi:hypothetical protein
MLIILPLENTPHGYGNLRAAALTLRRGLWFIMADGDHGVGRAILKNASGKILRRRIRMWSKNHFFRARL